jgi:ribonuclease HI
MTREFDAGSCARLELLAALWTFAQFESRRHDLRGSNPESSIQNATKFDANKTIGFLPLILYTDSQTIANLTTRRGKLFAKNFHSGRTGLPLTNGDLYRDFYSVYDRLSKEFNVMIHWTKGHTPKSGRTDTQTIFAQVDLAARNSLRKLTGSREMTYKTQTPPTPK